MANNTDWLASRLAELLVMFKNVNAKVGNYKDALPLTAAQITRIELICDIFINVYTFVEQTRTSTLSLVEWRDNIFKGSPKGDAAPQPPLFEAYTEVAGSFIGIITEFREWRELIVALPGYTQAIGEDLMIGTPAVASRHEDDTAPDLKVTTGNGYEINIAGSMQGMDAMRIEYQRNGTIGWLTAAFLTKMPGSFTIAPHAPGTPETGRIRAVFIKKNSDFGNLSPEYPVTLS